MRQDDPFRFTVCLDMVSHKLNWEDVVSVNGKRLSHLRVADNVVLIANIARETNEILQELNVKSK